MMTDSSPVATDSTKRARILRAALAVFAHAGVHGTPIPPIAAEAGVGVGTLYRYFDNKQALVNAVFCDAKLRLQAHLFEGLPLATPSKALFDELWSRLATFARREPDTFQFLEMQDHASYLDDTSRSVEYALLVPLRQIIALGQQADLLNSHLRPEVAMALFWGAFVGLIKASRLNYLTLTDDDLSQAREACWNSLANHAPTPSKEQNHD